MTSKQSINAFVPFVDALLVMLIVVMVLVSPKHSAKDVHVEAQYMVTIDWDSALDADIDLWAKCPDGQPVFFRNREHDALHLDRDSRGWLDYKVANPDGSFVWLPHRETITMRGIIPGRYEFGLHFYNFFPHDIGVDMSNINVVVHYEVVKVNPSAEVIARGKKVLQRVSDATNFFAMNVAADGSFIKEAVSEQPLATKFISDSFLDNHGTFGSPNNSTPSYLPQPDH